MTTAPLLPAPADRDALTRALAPLAQARAAGLGLDRAALAAQVYPAPSRAEVADVGRMLDGRLSLFGPRGLALLAALGLRELRPVWGLPVVAAPPRPNPG
ncbi:hypothetical protein [Deinococcus multiflagellatus]|uniref:Uncharacterized protein n=1 Tax=Deinococcus multiflagellatus TaxID=1656887 RepID=A0ABW1ZRC2_9DEIO